MEEFWNEIIHEFQVIKKGVVGTLPDLLKFIFFVLIAWLIIKVVLFLVNKVLLKSNIDKLSQKLGETEIFGDKLAKVVLSKIISGVLRWMLILTFLMIGAKMFGLTIVSDGIKYFFAYLPSLVTAIFIFVGGIYLGTVVKKAIIGVFKSMDLGGGKVIGNILFYLILVFISITSLEQAGVDTSIIKQNLTLLIGSILLAFTIAFGIGAKDAVKRLLFGYYSRKNIAIGSKIKVNGVEGKLLMIDNISAVISTKKGKVVMPIQEMVDNKVEILN